jgi:hypothetical protein
MQIRSALERTKSEIRTAHIVEVLDSSIKGPGGSMSRTHPAT